jgi:transposase InsO family protein
MGGMCSRRPVRTPQANAFCERLIGTMRRECLDWLIPVHEGHLRSILREWVPLQPGPPACQPLGPGRPRLAPCNKSGDGRRSGWSNDIVTSPMTSSTRRSASQAYTRRAHLRAQRDQRRRARLPEILRNPKPGSGYKMASHSMTSWNQILSSLRALDLLRKTVHTAA